MDKLRFNRLIVEAHGPNFRGHAVHRVFYISCVSDALRAFKYVARLQRRVDVSDVLVFDGMRSPIISMLPAFFDDKE